ncbi:MAG: DUF721 domain-containing protein [Owenweeksia sp.]
MKKDNQQSLGDAIRSFLAAHNLEDKYLETEIYSRWDELAGRAINVKTRKVNFREGVLTVFLSSATLRQELSMRRAEMIERLNQRIRNSPVRELVFK